MASQNALCDYALFLGASLENMNFTKDQFAELSKSCVGLKMYLGETYGLLNLQEDFVVWSKFFESYPRTKPIVVHAEHTAIAAVVLLAQSFNRHVHVAHVSKRDEILMIKAAKDRKIPVTCEVCPHHLFLTKELAEKTLPAASCAAVKPSLGNYVCFLSSFCFVLNWYKPENHILWRLRETYF